MIYNAASVTSSSVIGTSEVQRWDFKNKIES